MQTTIRKVTTPLDLLRVGRFRYEIYVEEMGRPQKHADHEARTLLEPLDDAGHVFIAEDEQGRIVGTVRSNFGGESDFDEYRELYALDRLGSFPLSAVSITTKMMVAPAYRRGTVAVRLAQAIYRFCLEAGNRSAEAL